ncbi:transposase [Tabrizicola sp.]|uniref:transposase n=1 Tax=Tabrizicola sp. TaxID=2005166 RepID=UPI003F316494
MIEQYALLSANARRLICVPGVGPITASAIVATIGEARQFGTGRDFAAWLGLTPLKQFSCGKDKLGRITNQGGRYIRSGDWFEQDWPFRPEIQRLRLVRQSPLLFQATADISDAVDLDRS